MRLLRGVYEGPGSHGILRVTASMRGVHTVLRALPGEGYFPALYAARERSGAAAPVSLSPVREKPQDPWGPGDLVRDLAGVVRRHPETGRRRPGPLGGRAPLGGARPGRGAARRSTGAPPTW